MQKPHDTELAGLMEQIISNGAEDMGSVFAGLFDLAMRLEREQFLDAGHYERSAGQRGYANGYKTKKLDTPGRRRDPERTEDGRSCGRVRRGILSVINGTGATVFPGGDVGSGGDVHQRRLDPRCRGCDERVWH